MKAIVQDEYGTADDLMLADIERPLVGTGEVLVRVHAASVFIGGTGRSSQVSRTRSARSSGSAGRRPAFGDKRWPGRIEAVGEGVTSFKVGDDVYGTCEGAFAEYVSVPANLLAPKPANLTFEQAATVAITGTTALQAVRDKGGVKPGQQVVIIGAAGGVGSFAVQIAHALGAHVTGVCNTARDRRRPIDRSGRT